ncbi:MAG: hypothetical protein ABIP06_12980 [Pyrinomonadaceae bacterium]
MKLILLSAFIFFAGCNSSTLSPSAENISEISLRMQTGLLGSASTISFAGDGAARCECTFYKLNENKKPNLDFVENICADLYRNNEQAFVKQKQTDGDVHLKAIFTGKITGQEFENITQTVRQSGFFQIVEKESNDVILDAPPNFVEVKYDGKSKQVSDADNDLSKIISAILETTQKTAWEKK